MLKFDLHLHSTYSDGVCSINEIIQTAKLKDISFLAITDHYTTSWKQSIINTINFNNFGQYINEIKIEREKLRSNCLISIEIDISSRLESIIRLPFEKFEIILFEYVDSIIMLKEIVKIVRYLKNPSIFCLAHNSYFRTGNIEEFSKILAENNIYFELNSRYLFNNSYELEKLKILKENSVQFTIGSDGHDKSAIGETGKAWDIIRKINGYENLINIDRFRIYE